ncbi:hypothetical protein E3Q13_01169 [Wallemia mellicola]|nr:hypothetical protein E3Q13_01169 [Wallemia mellicola]
MRLSSFNQDSNAMRTFFILLLAFITQCLLAHSHKPSPITKLSHPEDVSIDVLPRDPHTWPEFTKRGLDTSPAVKHDDNLRISFKLDDKLFNLHLHPNIDLFHPEGRINYFNNGKISHSEPLLKENYRMFHGFTVANHHSDTRLAQDAARLIRNDELNDLFQDDHLWVISNIMIHDDGVENNQSPQFEGSFTYDGELYHIKTPSSYLATMADEDPSPSYHPSRLIIFKESDTIERTNTTLVSSCATDSTHYPSLDIQPDDTQLPPFTLLDNKHVWSSPLMNWFEGLFGKSTRSKPFVRFAPLDDHTLDRAITQAKDRQRLRRQGTGDVSGGNDETASSLVDSIGSTDGCPTEQRLVYMGFAADCTYVQNYDSQENARTQILRDVNQISGLYKDTFRISLGVIELNVQEPSCPSTPDQSVEWNQDCSDSVSLNDRLSMFSAWRGQKGDDGAGLWHLMTKCNTGSEVGVAWISTLCQQQANSQGSQSVSGTAVTAITRNQWAVAAHEIGHNFGAIHDCEDGCSLQQSCCPLNRNTCDADNQYIMSATSSDSATKFSDCTVGNICSAMGSGSTSTSCLVNPSNSDRPIISLQQCGNGVVEDDEECDGGGDTKCCTSDCKFKDGAVCDTSTEACCDDNCQYAPSSQVCRPSIDSTCDYEEKCTGDSGACPEDKFKDNESAQLDYVLPKMINVNPLARLWVSQARAIWVVMTHVLLLATVLKEAAVFVSRLHSGMVLNVDTERAIVKREAGRTHSKIGTDRIYRSPYLCIFGGCFRRRRPAYLAAPPLPAKSRRNKLFARGSPNMPGGYSPVNQPPAAFTGQPFYPPPQQPPPNQGAPTHWVDPAAYNGRDYGR